MGGQSAVGCSDITAELLPATGYYEDQAEIDLYDKMLRDTDLAKQQGVNARIQEIRARRGGAADLAVVVVLDHPLPLLPYMKGWSPAAVASQEVTIFQAARPLLI
jgi:hypothetical protein